MRRRLAVSLDVGFSLVRTRHCFLARYAVKCWFIWSACNGKVLLPSMFKATHSISCAMTLSIRTWFHIYLPVRSFNCSCKLISRILFRKYILPFNSSDIDLFYWFGCDIIPSNCIHVWWLRSTGTITTRSVNIDGTSLITEITSFWSLNYYSNIIIAPDIMKVVRGWRSNVFT